MRGRVETATRREGGKKREKRRQKTGGKIQDTRCKMQGSPFRNFFPMTNALCLEPRPLFLEFTMMNLFTYILILAVGVIFVLMMRVILFLIREEQAVEIELAEIEETPTR